MFIIRRIRIEHFRGIEHLEMSLSSPTVLIGPNYTGKSTILHALRLCFANDISDAGIEDFYHLADEAPDTSRPVTVSARIVPVDERGVPVRRFDEADRAFFGDGLTEDDKGEYFAIRTEISVDARGAIAIKRKQIDDWRAPKRMRELPDGFIESIHVMILSPDQGPGDELEREHAHLEPLVASLVGNLDTNAGLALKRLAEMFSESLFGLKDVLEGGFSLSPERLKAFYDKRLSDASRLAALSPSMRRVILLLCTVAACALLRSKSAALGRPLFPFVLIEEPELHLHPNAQRAVMRALTSLAGQLVVTTFSPFVASSVAPLSYRAVERFGNTTRVRWLTDRLSPATLGTIERQVLRHRSEMLFARAVIFAEGITEEQLFEGMFRRFFHVSPDTMGVSVIGVGGKNYEPFILMATGLQKPFCIVSDNDGDTSHVLTHQIAQATEEQGLPEGTAGVFFLSRGHSIEHEIVLKLNLREEIADALTALNFNGRHVSEEESRRVWDRFFAMSDSQTVARLSKKKAEYSGILGEIVAANPYGKHLEESIPAALLAAFERIAEWLKLLPEHSTNQH